jgi:hypothetical protein
VERNFSRTEEEPNNKKIQLYSFRSIPSPLTVVGSREDMQDEIKDPATAYNSNNLS